MKQPNNLSRLKLKLMKEFDKEFLFICGLNSVDIRPEVKSFLSSAIDRTARETTEEMEKEFDKCLVQPTICLP